MIKVKFGIKASNGSIIREPITESEDFILLGYFISDTGGIVSEVISNLEIVLNGEKSFEEIMKDYGDWSFGSGSGVFECNQNTAYFIADDESMFRSFEMPLKDLVAILYEWKTYSEQPK